jgi:hypothetical protein
MADFYSGWASAPNGGTKYRLHLIVNVASQDVNANQSILEWDLRIEKDRSYQGFYDYWTDSSVVINGSTVHSQSNVQNPTSPWTGWSSHSLASGRHTVAHGTNGDKTISVSGNWSRHAGPSGFDWAPSAMATSGNMTLPTIARATTPTVSPNPATVGSTVTIATNRQSSSFTHDITWEAGGDSGTIATGVATSTTWTVPDVMDEFPGQVRAPIVITVVTKNGSTTVGSKQITLFAVNAPPAPSVEPRSPDKQFDIRARLVQWNDAEEEWRGGRILPAATIQMVDPNSATATCTITMSKLQAVDFEDFSIVDIEVYDGARWVFTNHRMVLSRVEGDDVDPSETYTYSGTEFVDYILGFAYAQYDMYWDGATNHWGPTSPGEMMRQAIADAKGRGWGPRIDIAFNGSQTSLGEPWANTSIKRTIPKGTPLSQALEGLVSDGYLEYRVEYHSEKAWLVLLNPGTGASYAADGSVPIVNLALANLSRAPRRGTMEKRLTRVTVMGDSVTNYGDPNTAADNTTNTAQATREQAPFDPDVFGHMEGWVSASGIGTNEEAAKIGDNALRDNSGIVNERTFEYNVQDVPPQFYPYFVFVPGDWILTPGVETPITDRVSQVTIDKQIDSMKLTILTGDRILSGTASLAKRQSAQTGGSIAGGNLGTPATLDARIPSAPEINSVTSAGYWDVDGAAKSEVTISWAAVTEALNGSGIAVDLYEVYWRAAVGGVWKFRGATADTEIDLPGWEPLQAVELRVRARSTAGVFGEFSEDQEHTTQAPTVDLDGPDLADLYTDGVGGIYAVWGGTLDGDPAPARLAYVVAEVSTDGGTVYTTEGTPIVAAGPIILNKSGAWGDYKVRLRGYDRLGNAGTASDPQDITITDPHIDPPAPRAPIDLVVTPGASWDAAGILPTAWFDLTWNPYRIVTELRRNYVTNPKLGTGSTNWASGGTLTGGTNARVAISDLPGFDWAWNRAVTSLNTGSRLRVTVGGLTIGETYTYGFWLKKHGSASYQGSVLNSANTSSVAGSFSTAVSVDDVWTWVTGQFVAAETIHQLAMRSTSSAATDQELWMTAAVIVHGALVLTSDDYLDGDLPDTPTRRYDWASTANASASVEYDITPLDQNDDPIDIAGYDVWGKKTGEVDLRLLTSTATPSVRISVKNGEEWSFQVSATSTFGGVSPLSDPVVDIADATISTAPAPTAPTLEQRTGLLRIKWAGGGMQPYIKYVYATISTTLGGTYSRAGMPLQGAGEIVVPGLAPGDYYAKIVMVDEMGQTSTSAAAGPITLLPITGETIQTSELANTGIKMTSAALTAYKASGVPSFILDATTGEVWIAAYDAVFDLGASGTEAETGDPTTGIAISAEDSTYNTFIHPSGVQIRNDQDPLSWWEPDADDSGNVNFVSPRARITDRFRVGDYEMKTEDKSGGGTRLVIRYKGA